jgi:hypothetical protein
MGRCLLWHSRKKHVFARQSTAREIFAFATGAPDNKSCAAVIITGFREPYHITL